MKVMLYGSPVAVLHQGLSERFSEASFVTADYTDKPEAIAERLEDCEAIVAVRLNGTVPVPPSVKLVQVPGIGYDEIVLDEVPAFVTVCNVGEHGPAVAEYVVGALLARAINLCEVDSAFRAGSWRHSSRMGALPHSELLGARVGLVGFGQIGREVASRLRPFGVTIEICNRSDIPASKLFDRYWPLASLTDMAAVCDILIVTVALTSETRGLVRDDVLSALPEGAVLVNVARGPIVDEDALFQALQSGHLGGAILDVWWAYPDSAKDLAARPSRHDFAKLTGVMVSPHISGWSRGTFSRRLDVMAENLRRLSLGQQLSNVVRRSS